MHEHEIVIEDPVGDYWEGAIVPVTTAHVLRARGVISLPIASGLVTRGGACGYYRRSWGAGWPLDSDQPRMQAPALLNIVRDERFRRICWAARLRPRTGVDASALEAGASFDGAIQLIGDSGQSGIMGAAVGRMLEQGFMEALSKDGGVIFGSHALEIAREGPGGLALYGRARGLRLEWLAITQSP